MRDLGVLMTTPLAAGVAILFLAVVGMAIARFPDAQPAAAAAAAPVAALTQDQRSEFERGWEVQTRETLPDSNDGAKVLVVKFNDYQCPSCKQAAYAFEPLLARYQPSEVKYLVKDFPLNPACNPGVHSLVHTAACDAAAATKMALAKGTFEKLTTWLFAHQEELSPATVRRAAKEVAGIDDYDAQYPKAIQAVMADAAEGAKLKIEWTPTFFINGKRVPRVGLPPQHFQAAIDLELKHAK
jgi:protein-disulfide isomerase